jgi:putative endonuclease
VRVRGRLAQLVEHFVYTEGVGGSNPSPPTSLRSRSEQGCRAEAERAKAGPCVRELRLGKPQSPARCGMIYVYILRSLEIPEHYYIGITTDPRARIKKHNELDVSHTSKYAPWQIKTYVAFSDKKQAFAFEKYLKSPSGRAFAKKRL